MMTVPPQLTSSLPSFSYPASFRHPPPASSTSIFRCYTHICSSQDFAGLDPWKRGFGTGKTTGRCRPSNWWNEVPGGADCLAQRTNDAFETNMKTANIPLLETWESYEASLPVREGTDGVSKLYSQPYLCRGKELDVAVSRLEHANEDRDRVAYLSAPTKRGKSAAILPIS